MLNYSKLPKHLQDSMERYIEDGIRSGGFLTAVLSNDLKGAVNVADSGNIKLLPDIVIWLYNEVPQECWGHEENLDTVANMSDMKLAEIRRLAEIQKATGSLHEYSMIVSMTLNSIQDNIEFLRSYLDVKTYRKSKQILQQNKAVRESKQNAKLDR